MKKFILYYLCFLLPIISGVVYATCDYTHYIEIGVAPKKLQILNTVAYYYGITGQQLSPYAFSIEDNRSDNGPYTGALSTVIGTDVNHCCFVIIEESNTPPTPRVTSFRCEGLPEILWIGLEPKAEMPDHYRLNFLYEHRV